MAFESLFSKLFQELHHSLLCPMSVGVLTIFHFSFHLLFSVKAHPFRLPPPVPLPTFLSSLANSSSLFSSYAPVSCTYSSYFSALLCFLLPLSTGPSHLSFFPLITSPSCHFAPLPLFPALGARFGCQAGGFCLPFLRDLVPFLVSSSLCPVAMPSLTAELDKRKYQRPRWADSLLP